MSREVTVKFTMAREMTREEAEEYIDRLMRLGFGACLRNEQETYDAIHSWKFKQKKGREAK